MKDSISSKVRNNLPDNAFGLPQRHEYPMPDAAHVRAAEAYFRYCPEELKPQLAKAILRKAAIFDVNVKSDVIHYYAQK